MSSSFGDAIVQSMVASMDPNVAMQREAMQGYVQVQKSKTEIALSEAVGTIGDKLEKAVASGAPAAVIAAYERSLARLG